MVYRVFLRLKGNNGLSVVMATYDTFITESFSKFSGVLIYFSDQSILMEIKSGPKKH